MADSPVTTVGTLLINDALPEDMRQPSHAITKDSLHKMFMRLAEKHPDRYKEVFQRLSDVGKTAAWTEGVSVSLAALRRSRAKEQLLAPVKVKLQEIVNDDNISDEERRKAVVDLLFQVAKPLQEEILKESDAEGSPFAMMVKSGARGKKADIVSLRGADLLATDQNDQLMPVPLMHSYAEGFTPAEYFASTYGQRKGALGVKMATADAGYLCFPGDTLVQMGDCSYKRIAEIEPGEYVMGADLTGKRFPVRVIERFNNGVKAVNRYVFRKGCNREEYIELVATPQHEVMARQLSYSSYRKKKGRSDFRVAHIGKRALAKFNSFTAAVPAAEVTHSLASCDVLPWQALVIGLLVGDGCLTGNNYTLASADPTLVEYVNQFLRPNNLEFAKIERAALSYEYILRFIVRPPYVRDEHGRVTSTTLNPIVRLATRLGLHGCRSFEKRFPDEIYSWSQESVASFLAGVFESDGSVSRANPNARTPHILLGMTSESVVRGVRRLLEERFGIYSATVKTSKSAVGTRHLVKQTGADAVCRHPNVYFGITRREAVERFARLIHMPGIKGVKLLDYLLSVAPSAEQDTSDSLFYFVRAEEAGTCEVYDLEVDHPDHLYVLKDQFVVSNSKRIVNAAHRQVVTRELPPITRLPVGLPVPVDDKDNIGAVLAHDAGDIKAGTTLTDKLLESLKDQGVDDILVHSPMTDLSEDGGISQMAAGRRERGYLSQIGDNVGVAAAQAVGEKLSQGMLCLAKGTLVQLPDGNTVAIEKVTPGMMVLGSDKSGRTFPVRVSALYRNGMQSCNTYSFSYPGSHSISFELTCTPAHKVLGHKYYSSLAGEVHQEEIIEIGKLSKISGIVTVRSFDSPYTTCDFRALLLGVILGDGCYTEAVRGVHLSCADQSQIEELNDYLRPHGMSFVRRKGHDIYYGLVDHASTGAGRIRRDPSSGRILGAVEQHRVRAWLKELGIYGKYAHEKVLPECVFTWNQASVAALLSGLYVTDGSVFKSRNVGAISYASTSRTLVEQVKWLLKFRFGINSAAIRSNDVGNRRYTLFSVSVCTQRDRVLFQQHIPLIGVKRARLKELIDTHVVNRETDTSWARIKRVSEAGVLETFDIEVDHPDHLFVLASGLIVSNSSKHAAGVADKASKSGMEYLNRLIEAPEYFPEAGPLVEEEGAVEEIRDAPQGGKYVTINKKEYYIHPHLNPVVRVGDHLDQGDLLSDGVPHPVDLVRLRGTGEARRVLLKELKEALSGSGVSAHRRNLEPVVAGLINWARVTDPDGIDEHIYDDVVPINKLNYMYKPRKTAEQLTPERSIGKYLEEPVLHYTPGTRVTKRVSDELKKWKVKDVFANAEPPPFEPTSIRGILGTYHDPDWKVRLSGFYTSSAFQKSLHRGAESDVESTSYVPAMTDPKVLGRNLQTLGKYGQADCEA